MSFFLIRRKIFGDFLEGLAIFVASRTSNGYKSSAEGIDLEIFREGKHYVVSIKSGPNWGNAAQHKKLIADFNNAVKVLKQTNKSIIVQPILGICYGNTKTSYLNNYWKLVGQNFWYFIVDEKIYTLILLIQSGLLPKNIREILKRKRENCLIILQKNFLKVRR